MAVSTACDRSAGPTPKGAQVHRRSSQIQRSSTKKATNLGQDLGLLQSCLSSPGKRQWVTLVWQRKSIWQASPSTAGCTSCRQPATINSPSDTVLYYTRISSHMSSYKPPWFLAFHGKAAAWRTETWASKTTWQIDTSPHYQVLVQFLPAATASIEPTLPSCPLTPHKHRALHTGMDGQTRHVQLSHITVSLKV